VTSGHQDVLIVGGGPAGAAAAIVCARAGVNVTVIDKATFPRDKICGDGLTSGALRLSEELGLRPSHVPSWKVIDDVYIRSPSGHRAHFPLPRDRGQFAAIATRQDFDAAMLQLARDAGATIAEATTSHDVSVTSDQVTVWTDTYGPITADYLIAADGMWSPTRKMLGLKHPDYRGEWHAFRQYWRNVSPQAAEELHIWFEPDVLPGYVWSFPLADGRANIGFGVHRTTHKVGQMGQIWPAILDRPHIREIIGHDAEPEGAHRAWPIPARLGDLPLTAVRTLFVGDAAGACDPMTGEGIAQALETGMIAANSILDAGPNHPGMATDTYVQSVDRSLVKDLRFAAWLSGALRTSMGAKAVVRTASFNNWAARNFARWLFEDYPRAILGTPSRWTRDMFTQPGSWR